MFRCFAVVIVLLFCSSQSFGYGFYTHFDINWSVAERLGYDENEAYLFVLGSIFCDIDKTDNLSLILLKKGNDREPIQPPNYFHKWKAIDRLIEVAGRDYPDLLPFAYGFKAHFLADQYGDEQVPLRLKDGQPNDIYDEVILDMDFYSGTYISSSFFRMYREALIKNERIVDLVVKVHLELYDDMDAWTREDYDLQIGSYRRLMVFYHELGPGIREIVSIDKNKGYRDDLFYQEEAAIIEEAIALAEGDLENDPLFLNDSLGFPAFPDFKLDYNQLDRSVFDDDSPYCLVGNDHEGTFVLILSVFLCSLLIIARRKPLVL